MAVLLKLPCGYGTTQSRSIMVWMWSVLEGSYVKRSVLSCSTTFGSYLWEKGPTSKIKVSWACPCSWVLSSVPQSLSVSQLWVDWPLSHAQNSMMFCLIIGLSIDLPFRNYRKHLKTNLHLVVPFRYLVLFFLSLLCFFFLFLSSFLPFFFFKI